MGFQGPPGSNSANYATAGSGPEASDYRPRGWFGCSKGLDLIGSSGLGRDGVNETLLSYRLVVYTNEDVNVACQAGLGTAQDDNGAGYFPAGTGGASGLCTASSDYPPDDGTAGYWRFTLDGMGPLVTYRDAPAHPMLNYSYRFAEDDCTVLKMSADGEWTPITLAAGFQQK